MKTKTAKKTCRKVGYSSQEKAKTALKDFGRARGAKRAYRCPFHNGQEIWHLTSEAR